MDRLIYFCSPFDGDRVTVTLTTIPLMEKDLEVIHKILVLSISDTYVARDKTKHVSINQLSHKRDNSPIYVYSAMARIN